MTDIHPNAVVDKNAELHETVEVGPFAVIGPHVKIGADSKVGAHVVIQGHCEIGTNNKFMPFSSIGGSPQDKKYRDEPTRLEIGNGNTIHEYVTISRGTIQDEGLTSVGDDNWIMAYAHIAHDVRLGSHTVLANTATIAGHVHIGDHAILGGFAKIHQFCKIGEHAFLGMDATVGQDIPPYVLAGGVPVAPRGINSEGLKRRGFDAEQMRAIKQAYRLVYRKGLKLQEAMDTLQPLAAENPVLIPFVEFIENSDRGLLRG